MINIVVPMAGAGSRFVEAGYSVPKPFIDVVGATMIERVLDNVVMPGARYILIANREHYSKQSEDVKRITRRYLVEWLTVDKLTEGAACTVLLARDVINNVTPLLMANSDQLVGIALADYVADSDDRGLDGSILTFCSDHPKWSYAAVNEDGIVTSVREKQVISRYATVGIYYYARGADFVRAADEMIAANDRYNNEFYTAPAYNYAIASGKKFGIYGIEESQMHGLGTPEDLETYLAYLERAYAAA